MEVCRSEITFYKPVLDTSDKEGDEERFITEGHRCQQLPKTERKSDIISGFTEVILAFELNFYFAPSLSLNRT